MMYAAVEKLYHEGVQVTPQWPRQIGAIGSYTSERDARRHCVKLWPMDFQPQVIDRFEPQAVLWLPEFVGIVGPYLLLRGLEEHGLPPRHRWVLQKWRCEIMERQAALRWLEPDKRFGEVQPYKPVAPPTAASQ